MLEYCTVRVKMRCIHAASKLCISGTVRCLIYLLYCIELPTTHTKTGTIQSPAAHAEALRPALSFRNERVDTMTPRSLRLALGRSAPLSIGDTHPPMVQSSRQRSKILFCPSYIYTQQTLLGLPLKMKPIQTRTTRDRDNRLSSQPAVRSRPSAIPRPASKKSTKLYLRRLAFRVFSGVSSPRKSQNGPVGYELDHARWRNAHQPWGSPGRRSAGR